MKFLFACWVSLVLAACAVAPVQPPQKKLSPDVQRDLERYASFHTGTFETQPQPASRGDSTPVKLRIARLWPERESEFWFYLEYAYPGREDTPYWQRLVRADEVRDGMEEAEYELPGDPRQFVGAWRDGKAFARVDISRLREIPGCRMRLQTQQITFFNSGMIARTCPSGVPPGAYRMSEAFMSSSSLRAWDRGYDKDGKIVWGSAAGPLDMLRSSSVPR